MRSLSLWTPNGTMWTSSSWTCRLCLVQIEGRRGYPASCTTPAEDGMVIWTETPKLHKLRRNVMELYISDHPLDCLTCPANGDCELQDMAGVVGLRNVRSGFEGANHLNDKADESNPTRKDTSRGGKGGVSPGESRWGP